VAQRNREHAVLVRPDAIVIARVPASDPVLMQVRELCYETLHRPFGVTRQADWNEADPSSSHFVAMAGDVLVGYARLVADGGTGHVRQVAVIPGMRGRGIAADLVVCALAHAREMRLVLACLNARERAVSTYERLGFRVVGEPFRMGRTYLPHVRMELPLR
jgi:ribosomal protein S18 acetylase RimI-like enzyme